MCTIQKLSEAKAKAILSPHQTIPVASCGRPVASCARSSEHEYPMCCRFHTMFADALHQLYAFPDMCTDYFQIRIKIALIIVSTRPHQLVRKINCMVLITIRFEAASTDDCTTDAYYPLRRDCGGEGRMSELRYFVYVLTSFLKYKIRKVEIMYSQSRRGKTASLEAIDRNTEVRHQACENGFFESGLCGKAP